MSIPDGAVVPANIPGIPFRPGLDWSNGSEPTKYSTISLRDDTSGTNVVVIDKSFTPATVDFTVR
ncbi:hypothetical protein AKJ09_01936 [Labilithrix luteola]|uniref:Uncharacterized protein n=1 Tax=Labilithrix luteola TaxID=1391654 RepID=A0A0K1PP39_9BACT|nr:hypothetical protein AKJ09_01936 [Labilithrix luteola]